VRAALGSAEEVPPTFGLVSTSVRTRCRR
jgi:hypothetical protein